MAKRSTALLALIYNHLLQHGLSETARKLQQESGENFNSHKKTLEKMYKHWNKKGKKKSEKKNERAQSKKTCQQDPVSTEASEDKGDEAKKAVPVTQDKKVSAKRTVKMKVDDPEAMDSTKKQASKAKAAPKTRKPAAQSKPSAAEVPAVLAQGIDGPNGEEEMASSAPVTEPPLKRTRAATMKSKTTNSRAAKQPKRASAKTTPAAAASATLVAASSTAVVKNDIHGGSESSDETDIEKQETPAPAVSKVRAPRAAKSTATQAKTKRGSSKTADVTPTSKVIKTSSTITKEDIEDLNTDSKKSPNPAVSKVKAAAPRAAKTTAAQAKAKKGSAKAAAATPASKGRTRASKSSKITDLEKTEESDLDSEFVPSSLDATAPSNVLTSNQRAPVRPTAQQSMADDSSESSETESEEEPMEQEKISSPKKKTIPASPAKAASAQAPKPEAATQDSESSDESDSEPEMVAAQVPTPSVVAAKSRAKPTAVTPASQSSAAVVRSPAKMAADESSEESDSDDAPSSAVKAPGLTSPKPSAPIPARVPDSDADSESSDSSDSELQLGQEVIASQNKTAVTPPASARKTIVTGKMVAQSKPSQDSSETSESEEEPQAAVITPQQRTMALGAKGKREVFTSAQPDEESSSEESEDDSDEPVKSVSQKVPTPAFAASKLKNTIIPTAVTPLSQGSAAAVKIPAKMAADETSDESDSDDEPPGLTRGTPSPKPSAPIPARVEDSDADSESSDSSDSEENAGLKDQASQTKITANLSSSVVKTEVVENTVAQSKTSQDSSETSESEEEKAQLSVATPQQRTARAATLQRKTTARAATPQQKTTARAATPQQKTTARAATPQQKTTARAATPQQKTTARAAKGMQGIATVTRPDESSSDKSEDSDEPGKSVPTPALSARNQKSIAKPTAVTPASQSSVTAARSPAKMVADESSEDSDSDDEVEALAQIPARVTVKKGKSALAPMLTPSKLGTVKSAGKTPVTMTHVTAKLSSKSPEMDSYKEVAAKGKMESVTLSQKTAKKTAAKVSEDVPGTAGDFADDASELENSQSLLQATPKRRKLTLDKKDKTTPANESTEMPSGKKSKAKTQLEAKPTPPAPITPAGLLDSEEETVLALLEGRSPKKARLKKNSKSGDVAAAPVTIQDSSVLERSLPRHVTSFPSEDEDFIIKSPPVPEHGQVSAKKSSKKRKSASEDSLCEEKGIKAKKAKKEEKLMAADITDEATSPKPSKKEKSEKKKDSDKTRRESKKLMESLVASFGESTDSGVGLQSQPKKKKGKSDKE